MVSKSIYFWILVCVIDPAILAPILAYAWSRHRGTYRQPPWLGSYLAVEVLDLAQGVLFIGLALSHQNNQWFRHLIQPVVFTGILWVVARISGPTGWRRLALTACWGLGLAAAVAGVFANGLFLRNALFTVTQSLVYLGIGTHELRRLLLQDDDEPLPDKPEFWLYTALLLYGSATLIFNASSNYFLKALPRHLLPLPWIVNGLVVVIYELFLAKVFLCRKSTSS